MGAIHCGGTTPGLPRALKHCPFYLWRNCCHLQVICTKITERLWPPNPFFGDVGILITLSPSLTMDKFYTYLCPHDSQGPLSTCWLFSSQDIVLKALIWPYNFWSLYEIWKIWTQIQGTGEEIWNPSFDVWPSTREDIPITISKEKCRAAMVEGIILPPTYSSLEEVIFARRNPSS